MNGWRLFVTSLPPLFGYCLRSTSLCFLSSSAVCATFCQLLHVTPLRHARLLSKPGAEGKLTEIAGAGGRPETHADGW